MTDSEQEILVTLEASLRALGVDSALIAKELDRLRASYEVKAPIPSLLDQAIATWPGRQGSRIAPFMGIWTKPQA